ncbi:MAG: hypothetical protein AAGU05_15220 [Anaerolineaceae bacterium]
MREYAANTTVRLIVGALALLFVVGLGLIYIIYGPNAAILGFLCLIAGIVPILLVLAVLALLEWISKRG